MYCRPYPLGVLKYYFLCVCLHNKGVPQEAYQGIMFPNTINWICKVCRSLRNLLQMLIICEQLRTKYKNVCPYCSVRCTIYLHLDDMIVFVLLLNLLAFTDNDSKVNGSFKIKGVYKDNYGNVGSDEAKDYISRLITEVGIFDFYSFGPLFQNYLRVPQF